MNDSQKGYDVFLEALRRIERAGERRHSAWLIGGSADEVARVRRELEAHPELLAMQQEARLLLWGRVESDALPEIYSRSTVVVMPSRRETFGLVAIEAMLCGVPVAASAVGGLKHTVVHSRTGAHFVSGDANAMAFILSSFIRNPRLPEWLGRNASRWARQSFARSAPDSGLSRILQAQAGETLPPHPIEDPERFFADEAAAEIAAHLGEDATLTTLTQRHHTTFRATRPGEGSWYIKCFTDRPDFDFSVYSIGPDLKSADRKARLHRTIVSADSPATLPAPERRGSVLLWPWAETADASDETALRAALRLAATIPNPDAGLVSACQAARRELVARPSWPALFAFDRAAALLNAPLTGAANVFVRCDPRVEVLRLRLHLAAAHWPLDQALRKRMDEVVDRAAEWIDGTETDAYLQHGDLRREHVVKWKGAEVVCDLEETRYAFGDLDAATLAWHLARSDRSSALECLQALTLAGAASSGSGRRLALLWSVVNALHWGLGRASWGALSDLAEACALCKSTIGAVNGSLR